jgi:hypothetical protein
MVHNSSNYFWYLHNRNQDSFCFVRSVDSYLLYLKNKLIEKLAGRLSFNLLDFTSFLNVN